MLARLAREVVRLADTEFLTALVPNADALKDYLLEIHREIPLVQLDTVMEEWRRGFVASGLPLEAEQDAQMAFAVRQALQLTPAEAADESVWWFLSVVRYPDIALARWSRGRSGGLRERMLGSCGRNAFARLWWGAELVGGREELVRQIFTNQDVFEAVIGRTLGRLPKALEVILEKLHDKPGKPARETIRDLGQVLSVLVLETLEKEELGRQIDDLYALEDR